VRAGSAFWPRERLMTRARVGLGGGLLLLSFLLSGCGPTDRPPQGLPGDPRAGLAVFKYLGCATCHAISLVAVGGGPTPGPALDGVGGRRSLAALREFLTTDRLHTQLRRPTAGELGDLISYLATLR